MKKTFLALFSVALLSAATVAHADTIFNLNQDACSGTCGSASPFGTVTLHQNGSGTTATVTVTVALATNENFAGTGAGDALVFNLFNDPPISVTGISLTGFQAAGGDKASAFGNFDYSITCDFSGGACHGGNGPTGPLSFTVGDASGVFINSFTANSGGFFFASDIMGNNGKTGNVGSEGATSTLPPPPTPEPSSLLLLGTGIVGAAGLVRRRMTSASTR